METQENNNSQSKGKNNILALLEIKRVNQVRQNSLLSNYIFFFSYKPLEKIHNYDL